MEWEYGNGDEGMDDDNNATTRTTAYIVNWMNAGTLPGEYKDLTGTTTGIYSNGTIQFDHVRKNLEGTYLCEARNGVGSGLSKVVFLKVNGE